MSYVVGVDFGTLSGRALLVRVSDGAEIATAVHPYASAVISPLTDWALQDPDDYRAQSFNGVCWRSPRTGPQYARCTAWFREISD